MDEEIKQLHTENLKHAETGMKILRDLSEKHEKIRERALTHTYQLITAIGIVAGFGFTAISSVQNIWVFLFGELLLLSAMAVGMWFVADGFIYEDNRLLLKWSNEVKNILDERMIISATDHNAKGKMDEIKKKELELFKEKDNLPSFVCLRFIFLLFILGGFFLLLSFLCLTN